MRVSVIAASLLLFLATLSSHGQPNKLIDILKRFETAAASGTPLPIDKADTVLDGIEQASEGSINQALPTVLKDAISPYVSVRRVTVELLFAIVIRPDGPKLLGSNTETFATLLIDPDIPIRRMTAYIIDDLHLGPHAPLLSSLRAYLGRADAVSTLGAAIAGLLMKDAPDDPGSVAAVVTFMRRKDQDSASRNDLLQSVQVTRSRNPQIGAAVATYIDDTSEATRIEAIRTMRAMGPSLVAGNRSILTKLVQDKRTSAATRAAAMEALSSP